jgi:hypothetical protein
MESDFTPDFEHHSVYPDEAAALAAVRAQDWAGVRALYDRATDWRGRERAMAGSSVKGAEDFLTDVVARHPDDLVAATMLATRLVRVGWDIRGSGRASTVSREQFDSFHGYLRRAEQILISVCARDPGFVPAWDERVTIARALSLGQSEARRRYDQVVRVEPHHLGAQLSLVQQLCPKWSGDFATMHAFAAECAAAAPAGYPNAALVVDGHMEHWLDVEGAERDAYFKAETVRSEILGAADRSVLNPAFDGQRGWIFPLSMFALGFTMIEDWPRAKWCFTSLRQYADSWGWSYLPGGATKAFVKWRAVAMERG